MDEYLKYLNSLSLSKNTMHKYLHDANIRKNPGKICEMAGVDQQKAFPQNFRNLYKKTYNEMQGKIIDRMGL